MDDLGGTTIFGNILMKDLEGETGSATKFFWLSKKSREKWLILVATQNSKLSKKVSWEMVDSSY